MGLAGHTSKTYPLVIWTLLLVATGTAIGVSSGAAITWLIGIAVLAIAVFGAITAPKWMLLAAIVLMPLEVAGRIDPDVPEITYVKVLLVIIVCGVAVRAMMLREPLTVPPGYWKLLGMWGVGALASLIGVLFFNRAMGAPALLALAGQIALVWLMWHLISSRADLTRAIIAVLIGSVFVSGVALLDLAAGRSVLGTVESLYHAAPGATFHRVTSTFWDPNALGRYLVFTLAFTWIGMVIVKSRFLKITIGALGVIQVAALVATFSRGAFLGLVVIAVLGVGWYLRKSVSQAVVLVGVLLLAAFGIAQLPHVHYLIERFVLSPELFGGRPELFRDALLAVIASPLVGYGPGLTVEAIGAIRGVPTSPHSLYLELLLSVGVIGALLVVGYVVQGMRSILAADDQELPLRALMILLWAGILAVGISLHGMDASEYWLAIGLLYPVVRVVRAPSAPVEGKRL